MKAKPVNYGPILVLAGAALWSTNAPFFKILQVDAYLAIFIRAMIAGILLLPTLRPKQIRFDWNLFVLLVSYSALCIGMVLAIRNTSANIATGMQYTAPVLLFILSLLKKECKPSLQEHWPLLVLIAGLLISMFSQSSAVTLQGNLLALFTAVTFAAVTVFSKKTTANNPLGIVSLTNLFCAAVVLLFFMPKDLPVQLAGITATEWLILVFLGVFQIAGGYALYYIGLKTTDPTQASMIAPCEMVLGPLWVAIFVKEYPDWIGILGSLVIIVGVIGEIIVSRKANAAHHSQAAVSDDKP